MMLQRKRLLADVPDDELITRDLEVYIKAKAFELMDLGERGVEVLVDRLNLEGFYRYFNELNASTAPYHNKYHARCMMLNCFEGALFEKCTTVEVRALVVAAMFHDFNHTGGHEPDEANIRLALEGLNLAQHAEMFFTPLTEKELELAIRAIRVTQYPFIHEPMTVTEKIIRDADLMQLYEADVPTMRAQYLGLKAEVEISRKVTFTQEEYAVGQRAWLDEYVVWYTAWARKKAEARSFEAHKDRLVEALRP